LVAAWTASSVNTLRAYLSPNAVSATTVALVVVVLFWALIIGVLVRSGITVFRSH
jgi:uncharacterized membrane protein